MSDFITGYQVGKSDNSGSGVLGLLGVFIAIILAVIAALAVGGAVLFVLLYPLATVIAILAVVLMTWGFSALIGVMWHDPSPVYLLAPHSFYFNWIGFGLAVLLGLLSAFVSVTEVEFRLHENRLYYGLRHMWRIGVPVTILAIVLVRTQAQTSLTSWGLWLIPLGLALALHFGLWSEAFSLREKFLEENPDRRRKALPAGA